MHRWGIPLTGIVAISLVVALSAVVVAEEAQTEATASEIQPRIEVGINLRSDFGVHAIRLDTAYVTERFRALLVVDPWFWTDGQSSTDITGFYRTRGFEPFLGWRLNAIPAVDGSQLQHNLLLGTALRFPEFLDGRISGEWGFETALMLYKHGGGVPANTISFASGRHYLDRVNFGMFARFHYNISLGGR